ncbi:tetratricopeptide repeat protein [Paenibacillus daejeonensis]|uniref:tetratricopeptide repeat protein n=1 Tax=Paenibacillus daejeonensis TaxID=135193 RepID=UPI00036C09D9|nr:tetratricopeptide repeat protein [Paenibacillus daejeonensis]
MPKLLVTILTFVAVVIIVGAAFITHWLLGIAVILLLVGVVYYRNRFMLYSMKANMAYTQGREEQALALLEKTTGLDGAGAREFMHYGYLLMKKGDLARAEQVFRDGLSRSKRREDEMQIKINLATVGWLQGNRSEAVALLEGVYDSFKTTMVYGNLGYLKLLHGDAEEALAFNLEAYDYNGEDQTIRDNLAQTYYTLGRYEEAEEMYKLVMAKSPRFAEPYYYYALTLRQLGRTDEAREQSAAALERQPALIPAVTRAELEQLAEELGVVREQEEEQEQQQV